jgi:hypothetical protein
MFYTNDYETQYVNVMGKLKNDINERNEKNETNETNNTNEENIVLYFNLEELGNYDLDIYNNSNLKIFTNKFNDIINYINDSLNIIDDINLIIFLVNYVKLSKKGFINHKMIYTKNNKLKLENILNHVFDKIDMKGKNCLWMSTLTQSFYDDMLFSIALSKTKFDEIETTHFLNIYERLLETCSNGYGTSYSNFYKKMQCFIENFEYFEFNFNKQDDNLYSLLTSCFLPKKLLCIIKNNFKIENIKSFLENAIIKNNEIFFDICDENIGYLSDDFLEKACFVKSINIIKYLLNNKINPNKKCFTNIFDFPIRRNTCMYKNSELTEIVNILLAYGYELTYDDVLLALSYKVGIINLEKYNIKLDDKFIELCHEHSFYNYSNLNIKPTLKCLEIECSKTNGNSAMIQQILNKNPNLKPSQLCIQKACSFCNNEKTIKLLLSHGLYIDVVCMENAFDCQNIRMIKFMFSIFQKNISCIHDNLKINSSIGFLNNTDDTDNTDTNNIVDFNNNNTIIVSNDSNDSNNSNDSISVDADINADINADIIIPVNVKPKSSITKKNTKSKSKNDVIYDNDLIEKIIIPDNFDVRTDKKFNDDFVSILKLNKNNKFQFCLIRKIFVEYLVKNKLIDNNNIIVNNILSILTNIEEKYKIEYKYLENIIYYFIE